MNYMKYQKGRANGWLIATIFLIILVLGTGGATVWAYLNYHDQKTNVDARVDAAVAEARREQSEVEQEKFLEEEKNPRREFAGPADYGRLSFDYPKTWSVYVSDDPIATGRGRDFKAYLHPMVVPSIDVREQRFAIRVSILGVSYDSHLKTYERQIEKGDLTSSAVNINGEASVRLDGSFSDIIRGSAVVFKIRDRTAVIQTDADTFKHDFDEIIKTISFVK